MLKKFVLLIAGLLSNSALAQLSTVERDLIKRVDDNNPQAVSLLKDIVNINSGTMNFSGVKKVAERLIPEFEALGFNARFEDGSEFNRAGHLVADYNGGNGPNILMIGHLDTVFEPDSPFQQFEMLDNNMAKGPGIADMKGGDVIILQTIKALSQANELQGLNIRVVMTGDEELSGLPLAKSKQALIEAAKWADIALGFENGDGNPHTANVSRRGSVDWTLTVAGHASHSSQIFKDSVGAGAIYEASRILTQFYSELRSEPLLTFNPGRIMGGTTIHHNKVSNSGDTFGKNNVVAQSAIVTGDIRAASLEQLARVKQKMRSIVADSLPQTHSEIDIGEGYPPMGATKGNQQLLQQYSRVSEDLGQGEVNAVNPLNAGAADVSFTAQYVSMALDGLGMSGSAGHTVNETGNMASLPNQTKRAVLLLYRLKTTKK